jgi:hypothetical protein
LACRRLHAQSAPHTLLVSFSQEESELERTRNGVNLHLMLDQAAVPFAALLVHWSPGQDRVATAGWRFAASAWNDCDAPIATAA